MVDAHVSISSEALSSLLKALGRQLMPGPLFPFVRDALKFSISAIETQ
jgi:hypothetical protein